MKKILVLIFTLIFAFSASIVVFAENSENNEAEQYEKTPADFSVECPSAFLMEAETGEVLFSQNQDDAASPASVTKVMTLLLVAEAIADGRISPDSVVSVSANASAMGGSQVFLKEGERFTVRDLLKCTVIASANDAAVALAECVSGSEEAFVRRMNERAKELEMENTNFENCTGLDDTTVNHVTSARDIALMSRELIKHSIITDYSSLWQDSIRDGEFVLTNTNRLVRFYDGCNGLKTGSTDKAGFCISVTAKRNGMRLIAVVMGAESRDSRNEIARELLDFGFANYAIFAEGENEVESIPVFRGAEDSVMTYSKPFAKVVNKSDMGAVTKKYVIPENLVAPIGEGEVVGKITYSVNDKVLGETELYVKEGVEKIGFWGLFCQIINTAITGNTKNEE